MLRTIDYTNPEEVCAYQLLLTKIYEREGGFAYPRVTNAEIREVQREGRVWLREVKLLINQILTSPIASQPPTPNSQRITQNAQRTTLNALPSLLASYDILHRICHGKPCHDYLREVKLQTADRWLKGDHSISKTDVVLMLLSEVDRDIRTLEKRYTQYALTILEQWVKELTVYGRFTGIPLDEAYRRLNYLLTEDLTPFLGSRDQRRLKQQWVNTHLPSLQPPTPNLQLSTQNATSFLLTASRLGYLPGTDHDTLYTSLLTNLSHNPSLHPLHKEAIEIDLLSTKPLAS